MLDFAGLIHYSAVALTVAVNGLGVGIGQGITTSSAITAMDQQPTAHNDILSVSILGIALIETAAVMGLFVSMLLLFGTNHDAHSLYGGMAEIGIIFAVCLPGLVLGIVSAFPTRAACMAVARQPFFAQKILRFMLIAVSLIQTPIIFGLIVALFIRMQAQHTYILTDAIRLMASGMCIGLGSIGPALGLSIYGQAACTGIGKNRQSYNSVVTFTFISQAIIETPIIFSLVVALSLLILVPSKENLLHGVALFSAALCTGIGTFGPGISSGKTSAAAVEQISLKPELYGELSRLSMFAQGLIESAAVYAVLVSFLLLFFV